MALMIGGCRSEKSPPKVEWLTPVEGAIITAGDAVPLRFLAEDPAPERGSTGPALWRIEIGPTTGGVWWTTAGELPEAPLDNPILDTVMATWQVPEGTPFSPSAAALLFKAIVTDGEGQQGADFLEGQWQVEPLESMGLWWAGASAGEGFSHVPSPTSSDPMVHPRDVDAQEWLVHLDGAELLVTGGALLRGWPLSGMDQEPAMQPAWTVEAPPSAAPQGILYLRTAPFEHTQSSWVESGWSDRCTWHDAQGSLRRTWLLESDETLMDAGIFGHDMVLLARTDAAEFRLIRYNIDSGARLGAVTWTPEAPGSQGPEGMGWLLALDGHPAALESDGTARVWNPEGGASPITSFGMPGSGAVSSAGRIGDGRIWLTRSDARILDASGTTLGWWDEPILHGAGDRTSDLLWILSGPTGSPRWQAASGPELTPTGGVFPAGPGARSGAVAHNRAGPP